MKVIDSVLKIILVIILLPIIILPIYVDLFKKQIWEYVQQKMESQKIHDKLMKDMKKNKSEQSKKKP